jgi:signal transduction histidine kinase
MDQLTRRDRLVRYAGGAMIAAAGLRAAYAAAFEPGQLAVTSHWMLKWIAAYAGFILAYAFMSEQASTRMSPREASLVTAQTVSALAMTWLYPSFLISCLLVVVAWQCALRLDFRPALVAVVAQVIALALIPCKVETPATWFLVLTGCTGFQVFALCAAQLARSEIAAREELARANTELTAAQALLDQSARLAERLRIARDLHDVMGHTLTTLTIHLDVASRLATGAAAEHVGHARAASGALLDQVRSVVSRFRAEPVDLRAVLQKLADGAVGLNVQLHMPADVVVPDPARAEAIVRCVQELITNAMRHSRGSELIIDLTSGPDGLLITARDDGHGGDFTPGHGLVGMRERFQILGGSLSISSAAGEGFTVRGDLPLAIDRH